MSQFQWSSKSKLHLQSCHPRIILLMDKVLLWSPIDMTIIEGHRSEERQEELFRTGRSKMSPGRSKHNLTPSMAVDYAPLKGSIVDWNDREYWLQHIGFIRGVAASMGIGVRTGADWDGDMDTRDQTFHDLPHLELR